MNTMVPDSPLVRGYRQWLEREAADMPAVVRDAVLALLGAVESGDVCIRLPAAEVAAWPAHPWVGAPGSYAPFILEPGGRFYLARYHDHEEAVARLLRERAATALAPADPARLRADLAALFPDDPADRQRQAALLAQFRALALVSGGPGTGKTTTVVKLLAMLTAQPSAQPLRIRLAAPTGKAAQRLMESIRASKAALGLAPEHAARIPEDAQTLHRLLGAQGDTGRFRHHRGSPLPCDLLLVDEASMVDLALMHALLDALPAGARLILLGDKDQLASVEAGSVFGDLCAHPGPSAALAAALAPYGAVLDAHPAATLLGDCRVELLRSYRFSASGGIGQLARAAREGDADGFLAAFAGDAAGAGVRRCERGALRERVAEGYADFRGAARSGDPDRAFAAFLRFRVLCAHRQGVAGVEGINALLEPAGGGWYVGRPVIVRANDYALRLFNGDIGLCLETPDGLRVFFEAGPGQYRVLAPGRLPAHEPAWAMTVHQSQGSEFDEVLLVLPDAITPVLNRPLVYTAVTRARRHFQLCAPDAILAAALAALPRRESGLVDKLQAPA